MLHSFDFRNELGKHLGKDPAVSVLEGEESRQAADWTLRKHCSDPTPQRPLVHPGPWLAWTDHQTFA